MKTIALIGLAAVAIAASAWAECPDADDDLVGAPGGDEVIVELRPGSDFPSYAASVGCTPVKWIAPLNLGLMTVAPPTTALQKADELNASGGPELKRADAHRAVEDPEGVQRTIGAIDIGLTRSQFLAQPAAVQTHVVQAHATLTGSSITVAVLDTGVASTNPELAGSLVSAGFSVFLGETSADVPPNGMDDDHDGSIDEMAGHGTHVAGLVHLVAPDARILPVRVLNDDGRGTSFDLAQGIVMAVDAGADVINLSLGLADDSLALERGIEYAAGHGVLIIAAAGNRGLQCVDVPADRTEAVAVAAVDGSFVKTPWSQCGPEVVLSAPGVDLISTYDATTWAHWDGTSFATPMVSGAAALLLQAHPELTSRDVKATLRSCTQPDANVSPIRELMGAGVLDLATIATVTPTLPGSLHVHEDAAGAEVEAESVEGAGLYDVGRGLVSELRLSGGHVDLGNVTCLADDVATPRVADPAHPPAGDAFFYVVRDDAFETESGAWGTYADGMERIASSGDCTF